MCLKGVIILSHQVKSLLILQEGNIIGALKQLSDVNYEGEMHAHYLQYHHELSIPSEITCYSPKKEIS